MPRQLRLEYPGAIYHVINRGDRREAVFRDDEDCRRFIETLGEACAKTTWQVHAYCLMGNHFHLVVETPQANLVAGMKWMLGTYTMRFNRRHKLSGHLFAGRYKSLLVDGSGNGYLRTVCDYVHLNPSRAGLLAPDQPLRLYPWSSFAHFLVPAEQRPTWLRVDRVLGEAGIKADTPAGRREFEAQLESRRVAEDTADWKILRRGWCYGQSEFREDLLRQVREIPGAHVPELVRASAEEKAETILRAELASRRWEEHNLAARRKGDPEKIQIARRLRRETTVSLKWIASRLHMGTWNYVANLLSAANGTGTSALRKPRSNQVRRGRGRSSDASETVVTATSDYQIPATAEEPTIDARHDAAPVPTALEEETLPVHCL